MLSRRLRAQCRFGGRSCGARLLCACGGEVWCRRAHRWEELCRLRARLVGDDLLAWLRCVGLLVRSRGSIGELSFAFALFRRNFKNKLIGARPMTMRCTFHHQHLNSSSCIFLIRMHHVYPSSAIDKTNEHTRIVILLCTAETLITDAARRAQNACLQHPIHKKVK